MLSAIRFLGGVHSKNKLCSGAVLHKLKLCGKCKGFLSQKEGEYFRSTEMDSGRTFEILFLLFLLKLQ